MSELSSNELDLTIPLLGGKVHGSLARAGKVKGQTPKVEKQQKKKKKTGRAKRRIQYNRRFVNVVQTFGRRRGLIFIIEYCLYKTTFRVYFKVTSKISS